MMFPWGKVKLNVIVQGCPGRFTICFGNGWPMPGKKAGRQAQVVPRDTPSSTINYPLCLVSGRCPPRVLLCTTTPQFLHRKTSKKQALLAQSVARETLNLKVGGSSPPQGFLFTFGTNYYYYVFFFSHSLVFPRVINTSRNQQR